MYIHTYVFLIGESCGVTELTLYVISVLYSCKARGITCLYIVRTCTCGRVIIKESL